MTDDPSDISPFAAVASLAEALAENERLRDRVTLLEAELAILRGTMSRPEDDDQPAVIHYDVEPNAPR